MSFPVPDWAVVIPGDSNGYSYFWDEVLAHEVFESFPLSPLWYVSLYHREGEEFVFVADRKGDPEPPPEKPAWKYLNPDDFSRR